MTHYNSWNKRKLPNLIITWTPIFPIRRFRHVSLAPLKYSPLTPSADVIHKIADSVITSKSADTDSHPIDSLMTQSWKLRVPSFFFPNFGVNKLIISIVERGKNGSFPPKTTKTINRFDLHGMY